MTEPEGVAVRREHVGFSNVCWETEEEREEARPANPADGASKVAMLMDRPRTMGSEEDEVEDVGVSRFGFFRWKRLFDGEIAEVGLVKGGVGPWVYREGSWNKGDDSSSSICNGGNLDARRRGGGGRGFCVDRGTFV